MKEFSLKLPASSANIGPGFDSVGIALNRYLTLNVSEGEKWEFQHSSPSLPSSTHYENHFIYQMANKMALQFNKNLPPANIKVESEIPLARGLGSSASAVVAGIELANQLCNLSLSNKEKLQCGSEIEGHPDNVAAVLFGGLVISVKTSAGAIEYLPLSPLNMDVVVYIPDIELKTEKARKALPSHFSRHQAASGSGISNLMIASLISGDYELAGKMMEQDLFHEPYRSNLIPYYNKLKYEAKQLGAFGTVISGAGPTMISFVPEGEGERIASGMSPLLPGYQVESLKIDNHGFQVSHQTV